MIAGPELVLKSVLHQQKRMAFQLQAGARIPACQTPPIIRQLPA
jgi:hypothetical protein